MSESIESLVSRLTPENRRLVNSLIDILNRYDTDELKMEVLRLLKADDFAGVRQVLLTNAILEIYQQLPAEGRQKLSDYVTDIVSSKQQAEG